MIRSGFELHGVQRLEIHCAPENQASAAIPERLGFTHEATLRERASDTDDVIRDLMIWSMLKEEYPESPASNTTLRAYNALNDLVLDS